MTQADRLLDLLRERGPNGVTPLEALRDVGTLRLAARIYDLRALGYDIESRELRVGGATVSRYVLHELSQMEMFG